MADESAGEQQPFVDNKQIAHLYIETSATMLSFLQWFDDNIDGW
jgi:hypothetical protein